MFLSVCAKDFGGTEYTAEKLQELAATGYIDYQELPGFNSVKSKFLQKLCNLIVKVMV
jgi:hypothetical protein